MSIPTRAADAAFALRTSGVKVSAGGATSYAIVRLHPEGIGDPGGHVPTQISDVRAVARVQAGTLALASGAAFQVLEGRFAGNYVIRDFTQIEDGEFVLVTLAVA